MASTNCWRCLSSTRPLIAANPLLTRTLLPSTTTSSFSTSTSLSHAPGAKKTGKLPTGGPKVRKAGEQTTFKRKKKNVPQKTGKAPMPGERKASRQRVVLSNTNAFEVPGLRDMDAKLLGEIVKGESAKEVVKEGEGDGKSGSGSAALVGKVVGLTGETVDALRAVDAFKSSQGWGFFRRPGVLLREESVTLSRRIVEAQKNKETLRMVVDGVRGSGKSLMLVHALATAHLKGWILMTIPEAQEVTNAVTSYSPIPGTSPLQYTQNAYITNMFTQMLKANKAVLSKLETTIDLSTLPIPIKEKKVNLARFLEIAVRDPESAWPMFEAFWKEITLPGRPPIMFTLDGFSHALRMSEYKNSKFESIHSLDLAIVRRFTDILSGATKLPNGGAVLAATSRSQAPTVKSLNLAITQQEDRQAGRDVTPLDPFERGYDARVEAALKGAEVFRVGGLKKSEAKGLMEYWAHSGVFRGMVDEKTVDEKWAVAGDGVVGEIERASLMMRI